VTILFLLIVISLFFFDLNLLKKTKLSVFKTGSLLFLWILITGFLANLGIFKLLNVLPPPFAIVVIPNIILLLVVTFSKETTQRLNSVSLSALTLIQSFRILMELILFDLAESGIISHLLTWEGRNIDIIIGVTAPIITVIAIKKWTYYKHVLLFWNYLGIALLINVFTHGLLSAPLPFQVFFTEPANTFVFSMPYIWLPAFVLPNAILFHILSIRKLRNSHQKNQ
jgi:hypothetical protein